MAAQSKDDKIDDEARFWEWFFNSLQPFRLKIIKAKDKISSTFIGDIYDSVAQLSEDISDTIHSTAQRISEITFSGIQRSPGALVALLLLITALIGRDAMDFEHQINGDVEIYLPDGANSTDLLNEVRQQWSTDIVILYVQTNNAATGSEKGIENITDSDILSQISWIEGDDNNKGQGGLKEGLDPNKEDRGSWACNSPESGCDGVVWILSPAQIIKEANSSNSRFSCAVERYGLPTSNGGCTFSNLNPNQGYSIPQGDGAQERIDEYVSNANALISNFVKDTNEDGIWDTGVIIMGISFDMANTDITPRSDPKGITEENKLGIIRDHKAFINHTQRLLDEAEESNCDLCTRKYNNPVSTMDQSRLDVIPSRKAITVTGLTPVLHDVSDRIYLELVETMLPASVFLVGLTMFILHRNFKVLIICGLPIIMSLAITFGSTVILDIMLTPMIISAGPILIGLGVDYSLHLTNRIEENRTNILKSRASSRTSSKQTFDEDSISYEDPFNPEISLKSTVMAIMTTGNAILLSALTTMIGFSVLTWKELVPIAPMRTVGITLLIGIFSTFLLSMLMVPALIELLKYRKGQSWNFSFSDKSQSDVKNISSIGQEKNYLNPKNIENQTSFSSRLSNDGKYKIFGINFLLFFVISTAISSSILYYLAPLSQSGALILGVTLSLTMTLSTLDQAWIEIGKLPIRNTLVVILFSLIVTMYGINIYNEELGKDITGSSDEVPPGLESYEALREYSIVFQGGQTNMFIVNAEERGPQNNTAPIRDLPILDSIEKMQVTKIDNVPQTTTISLVDILKAIHVDLELADQEIFEQSLWELIHNECWDESSNLLRPECWPYSASSREDMVNIAFDTLSPEIRSMLMNADEGLGETKTLVYVNQPYINLATAGNLREEIDNHLNGNGCDSALECSAMNIEGVSNSLLTGGLPVSLDINKAIHDSQSETTIATMGILLITMAILFRSPRLAIFTMTAVAVVVLWQPLLMRGGSVNVNVFTAMIGTIVFGIGVDDSIHIIDRIKDEGETPSGIVNTVSKTGRTIFETTATTCAGLSAGLFVAIPGLQNFFILMMLLLVLALLTSSILLPSIITSYHELSSRLSGKGTWIDYDESGTISSDSSLDAVLVD